MSTMQRHVVRFTVRDPDATIEFRGVGSGGMQRLTRPARYCVGEHVLLVSLPGLVAVAMFVDAEFAMQLRIEDRERREPKHGKKGVARDEP
jgi:hypothetical protein